MSVAPEHIPDQMAEVSTDLLAALRQTAPPSVPEGRDYWITILTRLSGGIAVASAIAVAVMAFYL